MNRADPNAIYALLEQLNIPFRKAEHPAAASMEELAAVEQQLRREGRREAFCKNLFLCNRQKTVFYLLLIREDKRFRTSVVSKLIGASRLSFGDETHLFDLLGVHPGAITPLGLAFDMEHQVHLLADRELLALDEIYVHPCVNTATVALKTADLFERYFAFTGHAPQLLDIPDEAETMD